MNTILLILLILIVLMTMSRTEMFTEQFGFSGYTKPIDPVLLKGTDMDLSEYEGLGLFPSGNSSIENEIQIFK